MCKNSTEVIPMHMMVRSLAEFSKQTKNNLSDCCKLLSESELKREMSLALHTASQLQAQLERIAAELEFKEKERTPQQTVITFMEQ